MKGSWAIVSLFVVASLLLVACGGNSSGATTGGARTSEETEAGPVLTKAKYVAEGDAICRKADEEQESALQDYLKKHPSAQSKPAGQVKMVEAAGLPPIDKEVEELAALGAPAGDEDQVRAIISGLEKALREGEENPQSLLGNSANPFESVGKLAAKYGFKACNNAL